MEEFYFAYQGNKRKELSEIMKYVNINDYDYIIEPYGGTCSFSRHVYHLDSNKKFRISDIDENVTFFCNNFHKYDDIIIKKTIKKVNKLENKQVYNEYIQNKPIANKDNIKEFLTYFLIYRSFYQVRPGLYPNNDRRPKYINLQKNKEKINEFFENVKYHHKDAFHFIDKYKNNERALLFIDPPYLTSSKGLYDRRIENNWERLYNFMDTCQCKFILVVDNNFFMKMSFKKWFKTSYSKTYSNKHTTTVHNIFTNIEL